ncbi:LINE-1 reverse transcriptase-like [Durusdinium trenchii]|uniref:LINE-1 reverse transcriptase-like n=1 Tax=Durusdinium trenchii TaxID=1381693 RepID=A0ABP0HSA4_9DINO
MLEAFVAKKDCSHTPDHFRPIALLSIVYRCWSSLRARQFLRQLIAYIHTDAYYGFLPEKETAQIWLLLQAQIECCLQAAMPLGGLSTDVVKAFNHIQRPPLFFLAAHVGAPPRLLQPWADFLVGLRRRFIVHNELGEAYLSNVGFPEGDPLSTAAMALLDWSMHVYQSRFAPSARTCSFVDNISIAGHQAQHVAMAYFSLQAFMALWGLLLDFSKTTFGAPPATCAASFGHLDFLFTKMPWNWAELFPLGPLGVTGFFRLKAPNLRIVGLGFGGLLPHSRSSSKHFLSFAGTKLCTVVKLVRLASSTCKHFGARLCFKSPELLDRWQSFMRAYSGRTLPGPFTRLATCLSEIGWSVTARPLVLDHDGFEHDLLALPRQAVHELLLDGWLQHVAHIVNKRHTMSDLAGMDTYLSRLDHDQLTAKQLAQTLALKEGAFISAWHQAKFDCTKQAFCAFCRVADHPGHWLSCPRFQDLRLHNPELTEAAGCWPQCTVHHLLVPRADFAFELKEYFLQLPAPGDFLSKPEEGLQELFTDGSSIDFVPGYIRAAAWAIQNATTGQPVATGHLTGLLQTVNRAELTAILVCVRWVLNFRARARIWTDSKYAHNWLRAGLELHVSQVPPSVDNHDLINELLADTALLDQGQIEIRWLPSHLALERCETASEEWAVLWNDQADRQAIRSNLDRSDTFWRLVAQGQERVDTWVPFLRDLRRFHLEVGDHLRTAQTDEADQVVDDTPWEEVVQHCSLDARLPEAWMSTFQLFKSDRVAEYAHWLLEAIRPLQDESVDFLPVSFIELTLYLFEREDFTIPHVREGQDLLIAPRRLFNRPTLARMVHAVRGAVREVCDFFDLSCYLTRGPRLESHIFLPCDCLILRPRPEVRSQLRELTSTFSGGRGIRKTADLARPPPSDRR